MPPRNAPGGSGQLGTPRVGRGWGNASGARAGRAAFSRSSPMPPALTTQVHRDRAAPRRDPGRDGRRLPTRLRPLARRLAALVARRLVRVPCGKQGRCGRPAWPKRVIGRGWAKLRGGLRHDLALREASREAAGQRLSHLVFRTGTVPSARTHCPPCQCTGWAASCSAAQSCVCREPRRDLCGPPLPLRQAVACTPGVQPLYVHESVLVLLVVGDVVGGAGQCR